MHVRHRSRCFSASFSRSRGVFARAALRTGAFLRGKNMEIAVGFGFFGDAGVETSERCRLARWMRL